MTKNKLKSTLDLSFADVNLSQAKLLLLDAQNNVDSTMAALDAVLGLDRQVTYDLVEDDTALKAPPADADQLLQLAFQQRPDLQALTYSQQAAVKFSHAQRDQMLPSISAAGTAGSVPIRPAEYYIIELVGRHWRQHEYSRSSMASFTRPRRRKRPSALRQLRNRAAICATGLHGMFAPLGLRQIPRISASLLSDELLKEANLALSTGTNTLPTGTQLDCGTEPGAVPADRCRNRQHRCAIPIPACPRHAQLPDRSKSMIENFG